MKKAFAVLVVLAMFPVGGCASSSPAPHPSPRTFDNVRRLAIVASGETRFAVLEHSSEPGRTFDEILKWNPYRAVLAPIMRLVHQGINWALESDRVSAASHHVDRLSPRTVVTDALARALEASGRFDQIRTLEREPVGEDRRRTDAIVRVTVPAWGLVRVREGEPDLLSAFADVRAQMVLRGTGVVVWEDNEDVTNPERLPLEAFTKDREFTRHELTEVLERAGQRLASELLYARGAGR
ncbi:MAG: hypothetical protein DMD89_18950 [Candidatus Rokuibacteriota bacterium]|nr:MAG: hypothetical protein DMD89_18950 [Candidatus Rokubacteria bacterium]